MVEIKDINLLDNESRVGSILTLCDIRFLIGKTLYEGVGVAAHTLCVGYGTCRDDTKIIILKLTPTKGDSDNVIGTLIHVAYRIANEIEESEALL